MLEVSCGGNDHTVISFSRECEHVNNFKINYGGGYFENLNNRSFSGYNEASENLATTKRTFNLKIIPQSQSTPECKEKEPSITKLESPTTISQVRSLCRSCVHNGNGSEATTSFPPNTFESLDVQPPLLDYLVRHHAISEESSLKIMQADKLQRPSLLLSAVGLPVFNGIINSKSSPTCSYAPPPGLALLLNALRHTGHHELASYLDCSRRINPSSVDGGMNSGCSDLSDKRRRGQISLWIQLLAIKVSPALYNQLAPNATRKDSFVLPSHVEKMQENNRPFNLNGQDERKPGHLQRLPSLPIWIDHTTTPRLATNTNQSNMDYVKPAENTIKSARNQWIKLLLPLVCCLRQSKSSNKMSPKNPPVDGCTKFNLANNETYRDISLHQNSSKDDSKCPIINSADDYKTRMVSRAILDSKSVQFYNTVLENGSSLRDAIVKYLEQSSGVLVLDCKLGRFSQTFNSNSMAPESVSALCVILIATQSEIIKRLSEDCSLHSSETKPSSTEVNNYLRLPVVKTLPSKLTLTSKLADDLATVLIRAGALCQLELQNLRLSVTLDPKEVQLAIKELMDLEE
ncbi:hypothetical protein MS3_00006809 [Schistosoma haematobium]|uniref:Uncharacterized protein n=1 Tax=Schistosoma haematobium TaxID=6185 RepID=A0A922IRW4_SCHHA|nr:hypothetical protein MS3_00006809 [Schistosoma haematobium]KAH9585612.1 hypothetical protein MS3_00006809 [Schistosoma haematobium]CAH8523924.1 unnamed protein product [Schistosoma haematobium]